jgi:hypothetical protein
MTVVDEARHRQCQHLPQTANILAYDKIIATTSSPDAFASKECEAPDPLRAAERARK